MSGCDLQIARLLKESIPSQSYQILMKIGHEITLSTATGLICDILGVVDCDARATIAWLASNGNIIEEKGWVRLP
jgi:hypothetical protein